MNDIVVWVFSIFFCSSIVFALWAFYAIRELETQVNLLRIRMNYISTGRER